MAEPTRAAEPGRFALRSPRCREGAVPGASAPRPKKKAFYLPRMKPLKEPAPNNNNNMSFVIHCQLGKEIKHICSNCSRGEDARDGECRGASGRRRAREAGRWLCRSPIWGHHRHLCPENCGGRGGRLPSRHFAERCPEPNPARILAQTIDVHAPPSEGLKQLKGQLWNFSLAKVGFGGD